MFAPYSCSINYTPSQRSSHTVECHTAARGEPKLPVRDAEGVPTMAECLGQTENDSRVPYIQHLPKCSSTTGLAAIS